MIKGIFFDFDGVLTFEKMGTPTMVSYIADKTNLPFEKVDNAYRKHNKSLLNGDITHKDMWDIFCKDIGMYVDFQVLIDSFLNVTLDKKLIEYIKEIKEEFVIGMITDNKVDRIETLLDKTELKGLFDVVIISGAVHSRKTERKIFEEALREANLLPSECIFIDNTAKNLDVPKSMGFTTIFFDDENRDFVAFKNKLSSMILND